MRMTMSNAGRTIQKGCSSVLIPLLIGVATVVISIIQLEIARQQRAHDSQIAIEQRQQDFLVADDLQKERVLATYIEQVSLLIITPNFSLADALTGNVIRAKTLLAIRQLDPKRKAHLMKFLYEAQMIRDQQANVKLADADLDHIDLSTKFIRDRAEGDYANPLLDLAFSRLSLNYVSFAHQIIRGGTFAESSLIAANFTGCRLSSISFERSVLCYADFSRASSREGLDFKQADLTGAIVPEQILHDALSTEDAILPNGTLGVQPNLLADGDAETPNCESDPSMPPAWQVEHLSGHVSLTVANYFSHPNVTSAKNLSLWNNHCFYAARGQQGEVSMRQIIPSKPVKQGKALLKFQLFCIPMKIDDLSQTSILLRIEQLDRNKNSLQNYTREIRLAGSVLRIIRVHPQLHQVLFSLTFVRVEINGNRTSPTDEIFAFCDNISLTRMPDRRNRTIVS